MPRGTILMLVGPEYEDLEVWYPKLRLEESGFEDVGHRVVLKIFSEYCARKMS